MLHARKEAVHFSMPIQHPRSLSDQRNTRMQLIGLRHRNRNNQEADDDPLSRRKSAGNAPPCTRNSAAADPAIEDEDSSVVTAEEEVTAESLQALDLLAHCAAEEIYDSAANSSAATRRVFVHSLGFYILQKRVKRSASIRTIIFHNSDGMRSKRKRAGILPSKFQDSVLLVNKKMKKTAKPSRSRKSK